MGITISYFSSGREERIVRELWCSDCNEYTNSYIDREGDGWWGPIMVHAKGADLEEWIDYICTEANEKNLKSCEILT